MFKNLLKLSMRPFAETRFGIRLSEIVLSVTFDKLFHLLSFESESRYQSRNKPVFKMFASFFALVFTSIILIFPISCDQKEKLVGMYLSESQASKKHSPISIELKENSIGLWKASDDEVTFIWSVRGQEIRLHTKSGGVIVGKIQGEIIEISLPGKQVMKFKRVQ